MRKRSAPTTGNIIAALDIGSHKVCCLIGALEPVYATGGQTGGQTTTQLRLLGLGHQRSQGIAAGGVVDLRSAQAAVAAAVSQAEHAAGLRIERVLLAAACGAPRSRTFNGHVDLPHGIVHDADIARLDAGARAFAVRDGGALLSLNRIAFALDTTPGVREPRGLAGQRLDANHHAVTVAPGPLRNLCLLVESCQLEPERLLPSGYASAIAATTDAERRAGVVCIDFGAGVSSIAGFADGHFIFAAGLPLGGQHITGDLARSGGFPLAEAERIKTLYGSLAPSALDEHEVVSLNENVLVMDGSSAITRAQVGRLVAGSTVRLLARILDCLEGSSVARLRHAGIVLTGGASELMGLEAFAAGEFKRPVRVSAPPRLDGAQGRLSGSVPSSAFSCVVGLALTAATPSHWIATRTPGAQPRHGYFGRVEQWLRESF